MQPLLSIRNLRVGFSTPQGLAEAVRGLDLELAPGKTLGLVGESGCGKSLTAFSAMGLLPSGARILDGHIKFNNQSMLDMDEKGWAKIRGSEISMIFQEPFTSLN